MADKSVPQLTALTSSTSGDLYHVVRSNIDYKIDFDNLQSSILGGTSGELTYKASLTIETADVLTLNGTPLLLIAAPSASYAIQVEHMAVYVNFNSVAYATNTNVDVYTDTATNVQFRATSALNASVNRIATGTSQAATGATDTQLIAGKAVYVKVATGNPTAGNSQVKIYVTYKLIEL